jgi:hypothetical protein
MSLAPTWRTPGMGHKQEDLTPYPVLIRPAGAYLWRVSWWLRYAGMRVGYE